MEKPRLPPIDYQAPPRGEPSWLSAKLRMLAELAVGSLIATIVFLILFWLFISNYHP